MFTLSKLLVGDTVPIQVVQSLRNAIDSDFVFLTEPKDSSLALETLPHIKPNTLNTEQVLVFKQYSKFNANYFAEQVLFLYKVVKPQNEKSFGEMASVIASSRVGLVLWMLKSQGATVVLLDAEKEIMNEENMIKHLEETSD